jgi:RNA polymerase sigma-70 factor (ECF subfamily)
MTPAQTSQVSDSLDHLFRHHAGQMVSVLSRIFGVGNIDAIEDSVQDALVAALQKWPFGETPDNPRAWLIEVAKNRLYDRLRREKRSDSIDDETHELIDLHDRTRDTHFVGEFGEDELKMIFACCHPAVPPDSQVALTLKTVGGFGVGEIAAAYLAKEEAVAKMLSRAKQKLRSGIRFEVPAGDELKPRLDAALRALYMMFNEGYAASTGEALIRRDLCFEAVRLARIIAGHPVTAAPKVHALIALFCFQAARLPARSDDRGDLVLLSEQDRSLWDGRMIAEGIEHLRRSAAGDELSDYHLEAEIASCYALAESFETIDWKRILKCYDLLQSGRYSPVVELNRIIAFGRVNGAEKALEELSRLGENYLMTSFNFFHLTRAYFLAELRQNERAAEAYRRAADLTRNDAVARFIQKRLAEISKIS